MSQSTLQLGYKVFQCLINKLIESIVIFLVFMQLTLSLIDRDEFEDIWVPQADEQLYLNYHERGIVNKGL